MATAMSAMSKMGGCFLPPRRDYSETSRPSPSVTGVGLSHPVHRLEGSSFPGGLPGAPLGSNEWGTRPSGRAQSSSLASERESYGLGGSIPGHLQKNSPNFQRGLTQKKGAPWKGNGKSGVWQAVVPEAPSLAAFKALSSSSASVGRGLLPSDPTEPLPPPPGSPSPVSAFPQWYSSPCHPALSPTSAPALPSSVQSHYSFLPGSVPCRTLQVSSHTRTIAVVC